MIVEIRGGGASWKRFEQPASQPTCLEVKDEAVEKRVQKEA